jgi:hypothetical protein
LVKSTYYIEAAIKVEHVSNVVIYVITSAAIIVAFHRMQNLKFNYDQKIDLEETLILVPLGGAASI